MSDKEPFEGDINRIKAWIHFKDRSDVDEDTQFLIDDVKLLFDLIAERDARIAELEKIEEKLRYNHMINEDAFFTNQKQAKEIRELKSKLSLAVEGLRFYADSSKWEAPMYPNYGRRLDVVHDKDVSEVVMKTGIRWSIGGKTARETIAKIEGEK